MSSSIYISILFPLELNRSSSRKVSTKGRKRKWFSAGGREVREEEKGKGKEEEKANNTE
jgi:hypothetical protein